MARPRKQDALTPAERMQRYRCAKKNQLEMLLGKSNVTETPVSSDKSHVTETEGLVLFALKHMQERCRRDDGTTYTLEQLVDMAIRSQLVTWGYSFAHEDSGVVCFGGCSLKPD